MHSSRRLCLCSRKYSRWEGWALHSEKTMHKYDQWVKAVNASKSQSAHENWSFTKEKSSIKSGKFHLFNSNKCYKSNSLSIVYLFRIQAHKKILNIKILLLSNDSKLMINNYNLIILQFYNIIYVINICLKNVTVLAETLIVRYQLYQPLPPIISTHSFFFFRLKSTGEIKCKNCKLKI